MKRLRRVVELAQRNLMNVVNGVARSLKYQQNVILSVKGSRVKLSILSIVILNGEGVSAFSHITSTSIGAEKTRNVKKARHKEKLSSKRVRNIAYIDR